MSGTIGRRRWLLKKAARAAVTFGSVGSGLVPLRDRNRPAPAARVLTYHRFTASTRDPFAVDPKRFEAQMAWLAQEGCAVGLGDLEAFLAGDATLPEHAVLVTIDDGCESVHDVAWPILRAHGVPAVLYAVAGSIGRSEGLDRDQPEPYLGWDALARMADEGLVIGSHAYHHRSLGQMSPSEAEEEATRSKALLEERLGRPVTSFAYPFGTRADFDERTREILARASYQTVFTSQHGPITPASDPHALPRIKVEGGETLTQFRWLCRGGLDAWAMVDRGLWRTQARA